MFPWLIQQCRIEKVKTLLVLGDVTDAKDNHSAELVNRVVKAFDSLREAVPRIVILKGNHDFLKAGNMFFQFLSALEGVEVITDPCEDATVGGSSAYFLPYSKDPVKDWAGFDFSHYDYLFMHQTVKGARSSNGQVMDGESLPPLNAGKVYSGDIHVPQVIAGVEYVGSPYHVHFGDAFAPRCVLLERDGKPVDLFFRSISRVTLNVDKYLSQGDIARANLGRGASLRRGDQVKLRIAVDESERHEWRRIKREAIAMLQDHGVIVHAVELIAGDTQRIDRPRVAALSPDAALKRFVEHEGLGGEVFDAAMDILEHK